ncbi:hypothetical protein CLAFUW4_13823 [Fulvia fulva]|uniref:Uncharacterized protein n=1 Tax=Passalora fulva TaxID=5499 RepID=A0A9Q8UVU9_PASFU|nr:uncharacterized protein CLAFUR5_13667 [Fulvia fulva]KAK4610267.1 hypothetical protein CLAFUR4_13825 [Fulvia fulva]KAK4610881.1 hypothetical protein CLAFUR0_13829 [Fulvia fulva]UJO24237.1 hypothetical protein CLAFUR5_13667 [Fulvia fulva]WPV22070.1 hypothetical protein CLAFUW4_13823 [Fulvia fulva]WPV36975.1 hypothetical protein CLAFUW7_13831 [Fulvia fulva]
MSQVQTVSETETEPTLKVTPEYQYPSTDHTKRAVESKIKLAPNETLTAHLLTHINSPTSTWETLSTLMRDPAYEEDGLCPASDLIAAIEASFEVFSAAQAELTKVWDPKSEFKLKKTPTQLHLKSLQYERFVKPKLEKGKGKDEVELSKRELRGWIMELIGAKDDVLEDLAKWRKAYGGV